MGDNRLAPVPKRLLDQAEPLTDIPPLKTVRELPYGSLSWQDFERLCLRILAVDYTLAGCRPHGVQGNDQDGIDLYAMNTCGRFTVCQCKNVQKFTAKMINEAVSKFEKGQWVAATDRFVLAVQIDLRRANTSLAIAAAKTRLKKLDIEFDVWDRTRLDLKLTAHPEIVGEFFHPAWVEAYCGESVAAPTPKRRKLRTSTTLIAVGLVVVACASGLLAVMRPLSTVPALAQASLDVEFRTNGSGWHHLPVKWEISGETGKADRRLPLFEAGFQNSRTIKAVVILPEGARATELRVHVNVNNADVARIEWLSLSPASSWKEIDLKEQDLPAGLRAFRRARVRLSQAPDRLALDAPFLSRCWKRRPSTTVSDRQALQINGTVATLQN